VCIWFDLLSAAVKVFGKERKLVERFERFALHYGFAHNFCNPDSPHEKGHVENKVGYNRRNFFVLRTMEEYNRELFGIAEKDM